MRLSISLGLTAAAVTLALAPPVAQAVTPVPGPTFTFSAETLQLNGDAAQMPPFTISNTEFMPNGTLVTITPSAGATFVNFATATYTNTPIIPVGAGATPTSNTGICNGLGNANTVSTSATSIVCQINSAGAISFNTPAGNAGAPNVNGQSFPTAGLPAPIVFGATSIRLAGVTGFGVASNSPFQVAGLSALDNPNLLQGALTFGATSLPSAQLYVQVTAPGSGLVNGAVPAGAVTVNNPTGALTQQPTNGTGIADAVPVAWGTIQGRALISAAPTAATLRVDLTANGAATRFVNTAISAPNNVSTAGFYGTVGLIENSGLLDARTGLAINSNTSAYSTVGGAPQAPTQPPGLNVQTSPALAAITNPGPCPANSNCGQAAANQLPSVVLSQGIVQANVAVTIRGNYPTIVSAFAVQNGGSASCTPSLVAGAGTIAGTLTTTSIDFQLPTPGTSPATNTLGGGGGFTEYAICLITNGNSVIMSSAGPNTMAGPANQMNNVNSNTIAAVATLATGTPFPILPGNTVFSTIQYQGAAYYFENVFGANNLYPSFFRIINQGASTVPVLAIVTKDNLVGTTQATNAPGGTSLFGTVAGTPPALAPAATIAVLQPNDATYVTADQVAATVGQTLTSGTGKATVWLVSTSTAFRASMVAQSLATGDLINLQ